MRHDVTLVVSKRVLRILPLLSSDHLSIVAMNEQDVIYRLAEVLDQHDLNGDDTSSTQELLHKISKHLDNAPMINLTAMAAQGAR